MPQNSLRTRITTGAFTLPTIAVGTLLLWVAVGIANIAIWESLFVTAITAYALVELSNRNTLLRVRSRMVSCSFLAFMLASDFLHDATIDLLPMFCWVIMLFCLFASYGKARAEGYTFYAFLSLSIASLCSPFLLTSAPLLFFSMIQQLRTLNWRTLFAGFLGLLLPYWFILGYGVWTRRVDEVFAQLVARFEWSTLDFGLLQTEQIGTWAVASCLFLAAVVHYLYTAYSDKIRIRMYYYLLIIQEVVLMIATLLHPQDFEIFFSVLVVNSAPLMAHHLTLSRGRWANIWMWTCITLLLGLTVFNYFDVWKVL